MKKFTLILFLILNNFLFSIGLNRDVDIIDMPLHEVLAILSKECGRNLICSKEAKDIVVDTYFNKGEDKMEENLHSIRVKIWTLF